MAKVIDKGLVPPDDPLFSSGLRIFGKPPMPSTPDSADLPIGNAPTPSKEPIQTRFLGQEARYIEEILGEWNVKYPGVDGMIQEDRIENLQLRRDCTFSWNPPPVWAPSAGVWGVIKVPGGLKLCFKDKHGRTRCGYLVLIPVKANGPYFMNWTRRRGDAVIFTDRIWRADRPRRK